MRPACALRPVCQASLAPDLLTQASCLPLKRSGTWESISTLFPSLQKGTASKAVPQSEMGVVGLGNRQGLWL